MTPSATATLERPAANLDTRPGPRQREGEPWSAFADRWAASLEGQAGIRQGRALGALLAPFHAAEKAGLYPTEPF